MTHKFLIVLWATLVLYSGAYAANTQRIHNEIEVLRVTRGALALCRADGCDPRIFQRLLELEDMIAPRSASARQNG